MQDQRRNGRVTRKYAHSLGISMKIWIATNGCAGDAVRICGSRQTRPNNRRIKKTFACLRNVPAYCFGKEAWGNPT
jgi:hypothetical protein